MTWRPVSPAQLPVLVADHLAARPGVVRVAVDGPPCAHPEELAESVREPLRERGRPAVHVRAESFWRDASLRLEYGHEDLESFPSWLDDGALRREVLDAAVDRATYLPSLRDPVTNRSTREPARALEPGTVVLVSGAFLLAADLPFDRTIHLAMSPAARARRIDPALAWTLPAYDDYDVSAAPSEAADIVVRMDDPRHPAVRGLAP